MAKKGGTSKRFTIDEVLLHMRQRHSHCPEETKETIARQVA
ncbi:hypothetical protein [Labrys monachus]|uniref:Uncharacterized protein n=1 Tax=Labrys monachus TaxID=217067 RepID=A0ABU0FDG3_9HYPH|nr:hypothetical protein [Labrys monachus]MDQ0392647.1 hypothetical protein [Labrys monachus]